MHDIIRITQPDPKSASQRRRELLSVLGGACLAIAATSVVLSYLEVDSLIFFALVNLNILILLLVIFVVIRNAIKVVLDRRRKLFGSRLRTRLALILMGLSLVPTVLMFIVGARFVQTSVNYWFRGRVETSMEMSMELGQAYFDAVIGNLENAGENLLEALRRMPEDSALEDGEALGRLLARARRDRDLAFAAWLTPEHGAAIEEGAREARHAWSLAARRFSWDAPDDGSPMRHILQPGGASDYAFAVFPLLGGREGYIVLGNSLGEGILFKLDRIATGLDEYRELKALKNPFRATFYFILALIGLLVTLGAMWFGLRLAREITAPLLALASGTERIARGDLSVRFEDEGEDEVTVLTGAFNRMTGDLEQSREKLTTANAELALRNREIEAHSRYVETVLDTIEAGVLAIDGEGRITSANKAALALVGRKTLAGRRLAEIFPEEEGPDIARLLEKFAAASPPIQRQQFSLGPAREHRVLLTAAALGFADADRSLVVVLEDVTELEKMQRLAAWQEVARRIAHEIKNPLTPIKLSAQRLERKFGASAADPAFGQCTRLIVAQVEHLQQMVTEFSSFAKLPEITLRPGRLEPILEELTALFRHSHPDISWELDIDGPLPELPLDAEALSRAFMNLLTNAAEALAESGGEKKGKVHIAAYLSADRHAIHVEIADNGSGLDEEERSRAFEPYFSRKKGGTGLGLAIVRSIISDHRGYVRAYGEPGYGTVMALDLPL